MFINLVIFMHRTIIYLKYGTKDKAAKSIFSSPSLEYFSFPHLVEHERAFNFIDGENISYNYIFAAEFDV